MQVLWAAARGLLRHALPVLVAQLASVGMMVVDTVVLGHFGAADLAAVAIGGGLYVSIVFALVGVLQAVSPMVAYRAGARQPDEVGAVLQHGLLLAGLLALPGFLFLQHPGVLLGWVGIEGALAARVRDYLAILAWGLPAALLYRTFYAFSNALGRARALMAIGLTGLLVHAVLAWGFALAGWLGEPLGARGCAFSNVLISWVNCLIAGLMLGFGPFGRLYRPFSHWAGLRWPIWREMLRLGVPIGASNFIEITAFALIAALVAPLGAVAVAGHRVVASLAALAYMLPLSLGIATLAATGHALGARDPAQARNVASAGLGLAGVLSLGVAALLWQVREPLLDLYTSDPAVRQFAESLLVYIVIYQLFDALQTVAGHALRAYRVTFAPMLVQLSCFWGVGLGLGWWLCYRGFGGMGVAGFWLAAAIGIVAAAALLGSMLWMVVREGNSSP